MCALIRIFASHVLFRKVGHNVYITGTVLILMYDVDTSNCLLY